MTSYARLDIDRQDNRLRDENEQLRTAIESVIEENTALAEDRDRLLGRMAALARELQSANSAYARGQPWVSPFDPDERQTRQSQNEEELRAAFEELEVLTEELEVANTNLQANNALLEERVAARTGELAASNAALGASEAAFRVLIEGMPQLSWRSLDGGDWTWASPQWEIYTGQTQAQSRGDGWLRALHPDDRAKADAAWARADATHPLEFEARIYHAPEGRHRHFQTRASPVIAEDGSVTEWLGTSTDVDDMLQLQRRQGVLVDELQHRTRNLMAVVHAITLRTIKGSKTLDEFRTCIDDRMQALARAQNLLSRRGLGKVTFDGLLFAELSTQVELDDGGNGAQISTAGERAIPLQSSIVQTLALAFHELLTNAVKYGALATPDGHLDVRWEVVLDDDDTAWLRIAWIESGVTMHDAANGPQGGGYGRELIERALPYQLGARTSYRFAADGVHCTIDVSVAPDEPESEGEA